MKTYLRQCMNCGGNCQSRNQWAEVMCPDCAKLKRQTAKHEEKWWDDFWSVQQKLSCTKYVKMRTAAGYD